MDKEIVEKLKLADAALGQYRSLIEPVAKELAKRKSRFVYRKDTAYIGQLGCYEAGVDTICLHISDQYSKHGEKNLKKALDFQDKWSKKAKLKNIKISGIS